ncbi:coatomer protein [Sistotremastrum suecicum HHB10207 ss-3]|uniref:Coatomer subunit zeta n=1 Tax=Sistotremastrum suecicum HHB10207 ss-3 TaxID=1314776 RepID=A0A165XHH7_9AGAM|nr:coatomer protein [Sistotremastrum suecicum HHB10207 ss-3]
MSNLTLYNVQALIILDSEGHRILSKYYSPKYPNALSPPSHTPQTLKDQKSLEKSLFEKTRKSPSASSSSGDILLLDGHLVLFKQSLDLWFYLLGGQGENELLLNAGFVGFLDALGLLFRGQVEKRALVDALDLVVLALDETFDDGIIIETDPATIASRVSRPRTDVASVGDIQINEQTIMNAYQTVRERMQRGLGAF